MHPYRFEQLVLDLLVAMGYGGSREEAARVTKRHLVLQRMRNHRLKTRRLSDPITGIPEATAERVRLGGEILKALAHAVAANEEAQRRFRAVLIMLGR